MYKYQKLLAEIHSLMCLSILFVMTIMKDTHTRGIVAQFSRLRLNLLELIISLNNSRQSNGWSVKNQSFHFRDTLQNLLID